jgi:hypothetical protein
LAGSLLSRSVLFSLLAALEHLKVSANEMIELIGVSGNFPFGELHYTA